MSRFIDFPRDVIRRIGAYMRAARDFGGHRRARLVYLLMLLVGLTVVLSGHKHGYPSARGPAVVCLIFAGTMLALDSRRWRSNKPVSRQLVEISRGAVTVSIFLLAYFFALTDYGAAELTANLVWITLTAVGVRRYFVAEQDRQELLEKARLQAELMELRGRLAAIEEHIGPLASPAIPFVPAAAAHLNLLEIRPIDLQ